MALAQTTSKMLLPAATSAAGSAGVIVGGTVATARDIKRVKDGEMTKSQAVVDVAKESVGTGLSTAAGVAVVGALGFGGLLGILGFVGVASGTKYLWNKAFGYTPEQKALKAS